MVKSHGSQLLDDEHDLVALDAGEVTAPFLLPARRKGEEDRWSIYLRLHPAAEQAWTHGLVRLEAFDVSLLEAAASWCLHNRQAPGVDPRWSVHLEPVADCERHLRSRLPVPIF